MILGEKSYSDCRNRGQSSCQSCRVRVIFLLASRLLEPSMYIPIRPSIIKVRISGWDMAVTMICD